MNQLSTLHHLQTFWACVFNAISIPPPPNPLGSNGWEVKKKSARSDVLVRTNMLSFRRGSTLERNVV